MVASDFESILYKRNLAPRYICYYTITQTICIMLRASILTFLLLSLYFPTSSNGDNDQNDLDIRARTLISHHVQFLDNRKKLLEDENLPLHGRKLGFEIYKKKKKKKKDGKSLANRSKMSIFHASFIFCISLLVSFMLSN